MKTLYLASGTDGITQACLSPGDKVVAIGVRRSGSCDLDNYLQNYGAYFEEKVVRLPEVPNWRYPSEPELHMLQPAVLTFKGMPK